MSYDLEIYLATTRREVSLIWTKTYRTLMDLSLQTLTEALAIRQRIIVLEDRLSSLFAAGSPRPASDSASRKRGSRKRRPMSAATHAKLTQSAKARWVRGKVLGSGPSGPSHGVSDTKSHRLDRVVADTWNLLKSVFDAKFCA